MPKKKKPSDEALALIGGDVKAEWYPTVRATAEGAHKLTEAIVTMAYYALEEQREAGDDIPPLMIGGKVNLAYEAVLRVQAVTYLQSLKLEADASTVEILADIFQRQLYMHHPDQWGSLAELLKSMAEGKSNSYQNIVEALVTIVIPFLEAEGLITIKEMMALVTAGGFSNLYHIRPELVQAVEDKDKDTLTELLNDAKSLSRTPLLVKWKKTPRIPPAKAVLTHTNPGWQIVITMTEAQKHLILNRLGRRISYE